MSKNSDNMKDIMRYTMDLNRLRWTMQDLIMENCYYKRIIKQAIKYIKSNMKDEYIHTDCIYTMIDILKGKGEDYE